MLHEVRVDAVRQETLLSRLGRRNEAKLCHIPEITQSILELDSVAFTLVVQGYQQVCRGVSRTPCRTMESLPARQVASAHPNTQQ